MKKTGLGRDPLKWIQTTIQPATPLEKKVVEDVKPEVIQNKKKLQDKTPKFKTFEVRLTSLLREDQLEFLDKLVRDIQKNRATEYKKERITKNTLIRVFIDAFKNLDIDTRNIPDEEALLERVKKYIR